MGIRKEMSKYSEYFAFIMNSDRVDYFQVSSGTETFLNRSNNMLEYFPVLFAQLEEIYNKSSFRP